MLLRLLPALACGLSLAAASVEEGALLLRVRDDGAGCEIASIREKERVGLGNLRERLGLLYAGASLRLEGGLGSKGELSSLSSSAAADEASASASSKGLEAKAKGFEARAKELASKAVKGVELPKLKP